MAAKKKPAAKKQTKRLARTTAGPATIEDHFDAETGELLHPKHELFAHAWAQTFDNEKACEAAGYQTEGIRGAYHSARQLLRRPEVQLRVRNILRDRIADLQMGEDWVVVKLIESYEKCMQEEPVVDNEGKVIGHKLRDPRTALSALELIGRNLGMFKKDEKAAARSVVFNFNYGQPRPEDAERMPRRRPIEGESRRLQ